MSLIFYQLFFWPSTLLRGWQLFKNHRRQMVKGRVYHAYLYRLMLGGYFLILGVAYGDALWFSTQLNWQISLVGLIFYAAAFVLRRVAMGALNTMFSPDIEIRDQHHLVQTGPYRLMRHPLLAALCLETLGNALLANSVWAVMLTLGAYWPLIAIRLRLEEKQLLQQFGTQYQSYQRRVWALFPFKSL